ncbi:hypothetical protein CLF_103311 [Clonorchis sinensis]|uniref:Uncharacterized protein n=1 Tax=Clonorchis sinensis TaxID=79923 RepID=G7Y9J3_CLOSI|nr:hypothetical protein CLF_103311 [Clonorchis sinensis]
MLNYGKRSYWVWRSRYPRRDVILWFTESPVNKQLRNAPEVFERIELPVRIPLWLRMLVEQLQVARFPSFMTVERALDEYLRTNIRHWCMLRENDKLRFWFLVDVLQIQQAACESSESSSSLANRNYNNNSKDSPKRFMYGAVHGPKYGVAMTVPRLPYPV